MNHLRSRHKIWVKIVATAVVCLFLVGDIARASAFQTEFTKTTLSPQSRLKPFFQKNGLGFQDIHTVIMATSELRKLVTTKEAREGAIYTKIEGLNKLFQNGEIEIENKILSGAFKSSRNKYKYAVFHFKKEGKKINVLFFKDDTVLTDEELAEIGIRDTEKHHLDCPGLEGVWFTNLFAEISPAPFAKIVEADEALSTINDQLKSGQTVLFGDMYRGEPSPQDDETWDRELFLDYVEQLGNLSTKFSVALELPCQLEDKLNDSSVSAEDFLDEYYKLLSGKYSPESAEAHSKTHRPYLSRLVKSLKDFKIPVILIDDIDSPIRGGFGADVDAIERSNEDMAQKILEGRKRYSNNPVLVKVGRNHVVSKIHSMWLGGREIKTIPGELRKSVDNVTLIRPDDVHYDQEDLEKFDLIVKINRKRLKTYFEITQKEPLAPKSLISGRSEHEVMQEEMERLITEGVTNVNAYSHIRSVAEQKLIEFDSDRADEAILKIKKWLVETTFSPLERGTIRQLMLTQSKEYFGLVNGFGAITYNEETERMEDLNSREEIHEDAFSDSIQAIDTLEGMGETNVISELLVLANKGLEAHKETVDLEEMQKRVDNARKQQNKDEERKYNIVWSSNFEAVRRWMAMENMILKCISNLGLRAGEASSEFEKANAFLSAVMLDYKATGEAYYWVRQQAAYRLRDYLTEETMKALDLATDKTTPEGQAPHPSTVFVAANLEAANPKALTIGLAAGMSRLHIQRTKAENEIIDEPQNFDFEKKQYRFVRLVGALDALKREDVDNALRIKIMERIAGIKSDEAAFSANFLLDAMEEMVKGQRNKYARIFTSDKISKELNNAKIRSAALKVISRIASAVLPKIQAKNMVLAKELVDDIAFLDGVSKGRKRYNAKRFKKIGRKLHVTLGNLHRLEKLESFAQGEEYLNFNRNVVIGSGGGASVSMSGVMDRITTDPALAIIGATDNGGATLLVRAFEVVNNGVFAGGFGDHVRFMYEAAVLEGAPGALMIRDLLNHRFGPGTKTLVEELKAQYPDKLKKAKQSGPREEERFQEVYEQLLEVAAKVDAAGFNGDFNSIKNMILEGLMYHTEGIGEEVMNPDGIYAAFEAFRRMLGAKSMAIPDVPIGNEISVKAADGEEYIGQSYYSHTPRGFGRGRQRSTLRIDEVDNYYPEVAIRSRIMGVISRAKLLLFGLGSWATSVGILFKNKSLVSAIADNTSDDKFLITNPVRDDEIRGMSWRESTVNFLESLMERRIGDVFKRILANANRNLNRQILTARPHLGTVEQVYDGYFGMYAGGNTPEPEDVEEMNNKGIKMVSELDMVSVKLSPMRTNPDLYNATVQYVPELFAEGLWRLMSDAAKALLSPKKEVALIKRKDEIEKLLHDKGLTFLDLGLDQIHEVIFNPVLVKELSEWLNNGIVPIWIEDKELRETMFQFIVKKAIERSTGGPLASASTSIRLSEEITVSKIQNKDVKVKFLNQDETDKIFPKSRVSLADDEDALREEELHRLGIIRGPTKTQNDILILLPYDILEAGDSPVNRMRRIEVALSFQLEKTKHLSTNKFKNELLAHQETLKSFDSRIEGGEQNDSRAILAELSAAIPYLRFLRSVIAEGKIPNTIFDMDGTFTAAGTPLTPEMAYYAWKFFKSPGSLKTVMTAQQFEGPFKQIIEEVEQVMRRLKWMEVRTGLDLEEEVNEGDLWAKVPIAVSSGGAVFLQDDREDSQNYVKVCQESMDDFTVSFLELAARLTMPDVGYPVDGHQIEFREPYQLPGGKIVYAGMAVIPSGRYDTQRNWDPRPACVQRILQGTRMAEMLKNPADLLKQVEASADSGEYFPDKSL